MNTIQAYPAEGVVVQDAHRHGQYGTEGTDNKAGTYVTSENESHTGGGVAAENDNEVLERDAQTKGRWFQYVKTKQFWITLLLGQGRCEVAAVVCESEQIADMGV